MKLKNKRTGYVADWCIDKDILRTCDGSIKYNSLTELNEDWEDAPEEPDLFYYIDADGCIKSHLVEDRDFNNVKDGVENLIAIGNRFETEEEAEKVVEKLKAWKRLRDKGFRFRNWNTSHHNLGVIEFFLPNIVNDVDEYRADLDLLFGDES